jgi:hypothetical protein
MFLEKGKYLDKHMRSYKIFKNLTGDGILFSPSNENWSIRRKSLTAAFYKDKLIKMIELMKSIAFERTQIWKN